MNVLDIVADELLIIKTDEEEYSYQEGDYIKIVLVSGIKVEGYIKSIDYDSVIIESENASLKYHYEKISKINR